MTERIHEEAMDSDVNVSCLCDDTGICATCGEALDPVGLFHGSDGEYMECRCLQCGDSCFCEAHDF